MNPKLFFIGTYTYGAVRNLVYAPRIKQDEYVTDRMMKFCVWTASTPLMFPIYMYCDLKNIEHVLRNMPGKIDRTPWD